MLVSGCAAYKLPPPDSQSNVGLLETASTIAVSGKDPTSYELANFEASLRAIGYLIAEEKTDDSSPAELSVTLLSGYDDRCFAEPMLTVLTVGVVPSKGCVIPGYIFELHDSASGTTIEIDTREEVTMLWGWAALLLLPSRNWVGEKGLQDYEANKLNRALSSALETATVQ